MTHCIEDIVTFMGAQYRIIDLGGSGSCEVVNLVTAQKFWISGQYLKGTSQMAMKKKPNRLPGMDELVDKELDEKCDELLSKERSKNKARLAYGECHLQLIDLMKKKGVKTYRHEESGQIWQIEATEKIKHKNLKEQAESNEINPGDGEDHEEDDLDAVGESDIIGGLKELADEGRDGDVIEKPKGKGKLAGYKRTVAT